MFGRSGRAYMEALQLREPYADQLRSALRVLDAIRPEVERVKKQIIQRIKEDPLAELLQTAPGIGELTAYLILTEVGPVERFPSQKQFVRYCCLAPGTWQSAEKKRDLPVGRRGNLYLKAALTSAVVSAVRVDAPLAAYWRRIQRRKGKSTALVVTARRLAISLYQMLKKRERYRSAPLKNRSVGKPRL
jgi:transposase